MKCCKCNLKVLITLLVLCVAFFVVSFVLAFVIFPDIKDNEITKATRLEHGTEQFDRFEKLPFPLDFKVYIFNVENPLEIISSAKPNVTEIGPFIYKQHRVKNIISEDSVEDTITYTQNLTFEFDNEASSNLTEDDVVTVLNPVLMSMYQIAENLGMAGQVTQCAQNFSFPYAVEGTNSLFLRLPVRTLLFDGFTFCGNTEGFICGIICSLAKGPRNIDIIDDPLLKFSFLSYKTKLDGVYTVYKGMKDIGTLGHISLWNNQKYTPYWGGNTTCDLVQGTDSTIYPPFITSKTDLFIFSTDICRVVEINYQHEAKHKDIDGYQFGTNPETLKSDSPNEDCFCVNQTKNLDGQLSCYLDGVMDVNTCFGAPILLSFPHFLWADDAYGSSVIGMSPDEEKHKIFLVIEPNTGTPLKGAKRIQLNSVLRPIPNSDLANVAKALLPLIWVDEGFELPQKYVDELRTSYFDKIMLLEGFKWALIAVSALLLIVLGGIILRKQLRKK